MADKKIGKVTHYYDKIGVAIVELAGNLKLGDSVTFKKGDDELLTQAVESMQIEKAGVDKAGKGDTIGLKVDEAVKEGAEVYV